MPTFNSNIEPESFDVFLCHNSEDKPEIRRIADELIKRGLKPWLDEREIKPGEFWQTALEEQIATIKSATVFVGESGIGPWQNIEMRAFINEFAERKCPVIPAILPRSKTKPTLPILLKNMHYVDFRVSDPNPIAQLKWGITGIKLLVGFADSAAEISALPPEKSKLSFLFDQVSNSTEEDISGQSNCKIYFPLNEAPPKEEQSQLSILRRRVNEFWIDGVLKQSLLTTPSPNG